MPFDPLVANAGRLQILTALAVEEKQEFVQLRRSTHLTDGNLASHARRLHAGGLVAIDKAFREGKPVTRIMLTAQGRSALEAHTRRLMAALSHRRLTPLAQQSADPAQTPEPAEPPTPIAPAVVPDVEQDWVD